MHSSLTQLHYTNVSVKLHTSGVEVSGYDMDDELRLWLARIERKLDMLLGEDDDEVDLDGQPSGSERDPRESLG